MNDSCPYGCCFDLADPTGVGDGFEVITHPDVHLDIDLGALHAAVEYEEGRSDREDEVYYYHSDHLGSASWITDGLGVAVQHLQYLPYGEPFVNQRTAGYTERFTFTGKERDEETGYGYFDARYMDHELMTGWLSVDPMSDKYPSLSPYNYCAWNPLKLVDPDGRDGRVVVTHNDDGSTSITISTTIFLKGDDKKMLNMLVKNAQFEANSLLKTKVIDNCTVSFNVLYKVFEDETELRQGDNILEVDPLNDSRSGVKGLQFTKYGIVVGGLTGNTGNVNSDIVNSIGGSKGKGILHETLHFLGLLDRYVDDHSFNGFEKDIMGHDARTATKFHESHYWAYIDRYRDENMGTRPYILLKERIDVDETERLKVNDAIR